VSFQEVIHPDLTEEAGVINWFAVSAHVTR
jgi:hypothetical protein